MRSSKALPPAPPSPLAPQCRFLKSKLGAPTVEDFTQLELQKQDLEEQLREARAQIEDLHHQVQKIISLHTSVPQQRQQLTKLRSTQIQSQKEEEETQVETELPQDNTA